MIEKELLDKIDKLKYDDLLELQEHINKQIGIEYNLKHTTTYHTTYVTKLFNTSLDDFFNDCFPFISGSYWDKIIYNVKKYYSDIEKLSVRNLYHFFNNNYIPEKLLGESKIGYKKILLINDYFKKYYLSIVDDNDKDYGLFHGIVRYDKSVDIDFFRSDLDSYLDESKYKPIVNYCRELFDRDDPRIYHLLLLDKEELLNVKGVGAATIENLESRINSNGISLVYLITYDKNLSFADKNKELVK